MAGSTSVDSHPPTELSLRRRQLLKFGGATVAGIAIGTPLMSSIASARDYQITKVPLSFANLPVGLHGLTIAQLSDVHSGIYMTEDHMMEIVELANSLHANIIALTGDHVDSSDREIPAVREAMRMLKSDYGIYGCLGNHDHFATAEKVSAALQQIGVVMLDNANRTLRINGERFSLIGVDDAGHGRSNFARLDDGLRGVDPQAFKILLSHRPEFFAQAKKAGMDLTLAGHTHGGQVGIEFWGINLNPAYLFTNYVRGLFREDGKQMYVNVGVGMVGVPIRIVRPEITLITLQRAE
jgi:predicted MPP superfamily phosphohydrolase